MKTLLLAALLATTTERTEPPCVTRAEVSDMMLFIMPALIEGAAEKCRAALPGDAYLFVGARDLGARLKAESKEHYAGTISAIEKMGGTTMPKNLSEQTVRGLIADGMQGELLADLKPSQCGDINEMAELLAPLPPSNLGGLATLLMRLGMGEKKGKGPQICAAAE